MGEFEFKSSKELSVLTLEDLCKYYRELRKYELENVDPTMGIKIRKNIHGVVIALLTLNRKLLLKQKITVVGDKRIKNDKPKIYAVTHVGRYDIENTIQVLKDDAYFVWGDPGELYRSPEMLLLNLIGMIFVDTDDKEDRRVAKETMVKVLECGGNILIYPEGAWNITENEVVMKLFTGAVEAAIRTGAEIIPVALEQYDNHYYYNIGQNIDLSWKSLSQKRELTDELRDVMCTLKWEIWEMFDPIKRAKLPDNYAEEFLDNIMKESDNGYTIEEIEKTRYKDPNIATPDEVFAFKKKLVL